MKFRYLIGASALLLSACQQKEPADGKFSEAGDGQVANVSFGDETAPAQREQAVPRPTREPPSAVREDVIMARFTETTSRKRMIEAPEGPIIERGAHAKPSPTIGIGAYQPPATQPPPQNLHVETKPHEFQQTSEETMSTFALDVDIASYSIGRQSLNGGYWPAPQSVRVEEWINYFDADVPVEKGETFGTLVEAAPNPLSGDSDNYIMRIALKAMTPEERKPWSLTLLVDTSGSMGPANRLPLAKYSMKQLVDQMRAGDIISLVSYSGSNEVKLAATSDKAKLKKAIDALEAAGGTAMGSGMDVAYQEALKNQKANAVNRVIVFSDGDANIGNTQPEVILENIRAKREDGITMMTVGMGNGRFNDAMMEKLANAGDGKYVYIDTEQGLRMAGCELDGRRRFRRAGAGRLQS